MKNPFNPLDESPVWQIRALHEGNCFFKYNNDILRKNTEKLVDYITKNKYDLYTVKREIFIKGNICRILGIPTGSFFDFCFMKCESKNRKRKDETKRIFLQMYPDYDNVIKNVHEECKYYFPLHRHLFIMRTDLFLEYIKRLFDYLFELERYIDKHHFQTKGIYGVGENRFMGIFSEVFINYWKMYTERERGIKVLSKSNLIFFTN